MSSVLFPPGIVSPQRLAELVTLLYLGRLEQRPWQSFLSQLRAHTGGDFAMLLLSATAQRSTTPAYWNASPEVLERMQLSERYAEPGYAGNCLIDIPRRSAWLASFDSPLCAASHSQQCMRLFGVTSLLTVHGEKMSCGIGRIEGRFDDIGKQVLRLLTPHLNRN